MASTIKAEVSETLRKQDHSFITRRIDFNNDNVKSQRFKVSKSTESSSVCYYSVFITLFKKCIVIIEERKLSQMFAISIPYRTH